MSNYKLIAIALGCVMLSSCTAQTVNSTVISSSSLLSSIDNSSVLSSNDVLLSSSIQSSDKNNPISSTISSSTASSVNAKTSNKAKRIIKIFRNLLYPIIVSPEASPIINDPAIYECNSNYKLASNLLYKSRKTKTKLSNTDKIFKKNIIEFLKYNLIGVNWSPERRKGKKVDIHDFVHLKPIDGYEIFTFKCENASMVMSSTYNRLAGYQFLTEPDYKMSELSYTLEGQDKYGNIKVQIKTKMYYSGILLYKDGKYELLEDAYMDGKITGETVGKIYKAMPQYLQYGKFDNYKDAYMLTPYKFTKSNDFEVSRDTVDFIRYYDKNGKLHIVY